MRVYQHQWSRRLQSHPPPVPKPSRFATTPTTLFARRIDACDSPEPAAWTKTSLDAIGPAASNARRKSAAAVTAPLSANVSGIPIEAKWPEWRNAKHAEQWDHNNKGEILRVGMPRPGAAYEC